jgi:hypothetical protein
VLFLLRPRQTWMPYALPRSPEQQAVYNEELHRAYSSTRRLPPPAPSPVPSRPSDVVGQLKDLAALHDAGKVSDDEFVALKAKLLAD